ncbi:MAG TPA: hypothetical protein DCL63_02610 [Firmicutes bacterium]|jgi:hypothetical protein|nr:hypothetical protein [Bacillota bacterium]
MFVQRDAGAFLLWLAACPHGTGSWEGPLGSDACRAGLIRIARKHGVVSVCIFGSYARGDADRESDLDALSDQITVSKATLGGGDPEVLGRIPNTPQAVAKLVRKRLGDMDKLHPHYVLDLTRTQAHLL